jgi:hypothetical protein
MVKVKAHRGEPLARLKIRLLRGHIYIRQYTINGRKVSSVFSYSFATTLAGTLRCGGRPLASAALHAEPSGEFQPAVDAERRGHRVHPPRCLSLPFHHLNPPLWAVVPNKALSLSLSLSHSLSLSQPGRVPHRGLWTLKMLVRGNVVIRRAQKGVPRRSRRGVETSVGPYQETLLISGACQMKSASNPSLLTNQQTSEVPGPPDPGLAGEPWVATRSANAGGCTAAAAADGGNEVCCVFSLLMALPRTHALADI